MNMSRFYLFYLEAAELLIYVIKHNDVGPHRSAIPSLSTLPPSNLSTNIETLKFYFAKYLSRD